VLRLLRGPVPAPPILGGGSCLGYRGAGRAPGYPGWGRGLFGQGRGLGLAARGVIGLRLGLLTVVGGIGGCGSGFRAGALGARLWVLPGKAVAEDFGLGSLNLGWPAYKTLHRTRNNKYLSLRKTIKHCFRYIGSLVRSRINSSPLESTTRYDYLLCSLKFPLKWEIHNNIIMYITVSTPIMTCTVRYFLFIVFNKVWLYHSIYGVSIKMGDSEQHYDVHNNVI
jgi:hypothetical protein